LLAFQAGVLSLDHAAGRLSLQWPVSVGVHAIAASVRKLGPRILVIACRQRKLGGDVMRTLDYEKRQSSKRGSDVGRNVQATRL
jgi:hypothetical protein